MSYEGYEELICKHGHLTTNHNIYGGNFENTCRICGCDIAYMHNVDTTNGRENDDPTTYPAETNSVGFEEVWNVDYLGNNYATKQELVAPNSSQWRSTVPPYTRVETTESRNLCPGCGNISTERSEASYDAFICNTWECKVFEFKPEKIR